MNKERLPTIQEEDTESRVDPTELREELIRLAESGDIKNTVMSIKKLNRASLERVKRDYVRKHTDEANELIANTVITKISDLMNSLEIITEPGKMGDELMENKLVKRDLKNIIGYVTPIIPLIGLLCGGIIVGKHVISSRNSNKDTDPNANMKTDKDRDPKANTDDDKDKNLQ